ncbi:hypothetical protein SCHPADRAFT_908009 [Schizopora paradoxa]|uniref:Uncharacterized protein n=1 Tax=Schizopora paradoxa TaxID=27342 RepID=A0A0H2RBH0_9AGAM|nr:hypothetical protein SCHPADRAFT_908009 [Schizopora paradoxa]
MTSLSNNIALIGKHSDEFKSELKKAGFTPVEFDSTKHVLEDTDSHQAISISGSEHGLTDKASISQLFDAGKVLVAFEPGVEYLKALHAATRTPIDLAATKPTVDHPLMVHKENGNVILTLTPKVKTNFEVPDGKFHPVHKSDLNILPNAKVLERAEGTPYSPGQLVEHIKRAVRVVDGAPAEIPAATGEVYGLDPDPDIAFYKKVQIRILADYSIKTLAFTAESDDVPTSDESHIQVYRTEWQMTIYVYATDVNPVGKTADNYEGTIYTYVVHDGFHGRKSGSPKRSVIKADYDNYRNWTYYFVDILRYDFQDTSGTLSKVTQQPNDNLYDHRDNTFAYNIAQEQKMMLFRAAKNKRWEFGARYQKPCAWNRFQMHQDTSTWDDAGYVISYNDYYDVWSDPEFKGKTWYKPGVFEETRIKILPDDNIPISGLTVFSSSVGKAPLRT